MKPCLGHPSRSSAIIEMNRKGMTEREIADRLRIKPNTVSSMLARAKRREKKPLEIERNLFEDLRREAWKRGTTPQNLAHQLLATVIRDKLVEAVIDQENSRVTD